MIILVIAPLLFANAPQPWFTTVLQFSDGSTELCASYGSNWDGTTLTVQVQSCRPDAIFSDGFEP